MLLVQCMFESTVALVWRSGVGTRGLGEDQHELLNMNINAFLILMTYE